MKKKVMLGLLAVLVLLGLAFGLRQLMTQRREAARRSELLASADAAFAAGDYDAAGALYKALELPERAADCEQKSFDTRLAAADALLEAGDYAAAREAFRALGGFERGAERVA